MSSLCGVSVVSVCLCALSCSLGSHHWPSATQGLKRVRAGGPLYSHFTLTPTWQVRNKQEAQEACVSHPIHNSCLPLPLQYLSGLQDSSLQYCPPTLVKKSVSLQFWEEQTQAEMQARRQNHLPCGKRRYPWAFGT